MSIARHTSYNLAASLVPIAVSFCTVPLYIGIMGEARYGMMAIFALLLGYFGFFDFGLSRAVAQRIAAAKGDLAQLREIFWTGAAANLLLGLIGGIAVLPAAWWYLGGQVRIEAELRPEMLAAAPWLALAVPVLLTTGMLRGALQGVQRFAELNLISATGAVFSQLATLWVAWAVAPSLAVVLPALFCTQLLLLAALLFAVARHVVQGWAVRFDRRRIGDLLSFGGWVAISSLVSPLMTMLDRFLIGSTFGSRHVAYYTVPFQLGERSVVIPLALGDALFPRIAAGDEAAARAIALRAMRVVSAVMTLLLATGILVLRPFLELYISPGFAQMAAPAGRVLFAGWAMNCYGLCCFVCLQAGGRPRLVAIAHLIEVVPFLALLAIGLHWWGIVGAAVAFGVRVAVDSLLLARFSGLLRETVALAAAPTGVIALTLLAAFVGDTQPVPGAILGLVAVTAALAIALHRFARENLRPSSLALRLRASRAPERSA